MTTTTINTDVLHSEGLAAYLAKSDRRILTGFRVALEALGLPLPQAAARTPPGYKPGKALAAAYAADEAIHGDRTFTTSGNRRLAPEGKLPPRVTSHEIRTARPETVEAAHTLFNDVFGREPN